ncbi:MAG TPA: biotin--[acetyl-CoA-carboxylase] ligase [Nannocystis exedens]|nr:biotin--[acetyl-CoA-carboxylase] ligase [Nannocystis exedens]
MALEHDLLGLRETLMTVAIGQLHEHYETLDSTNDRALAWAQEGAPHGALVTADRQLAGRGRRGHSWCSPATGDLYFSVVIRPDFFSFSSFSSSLSSSSGQHLASIPGDRSKKKLSRGVTAGFSWGAYGLAVGVALREGLLRWLGELASCGGIELKWPNDLLWRGRKLGGILCEGRWQNGTLQVIVVGVGINLARRQFVDPELAERATSIALALEDCGQAVEPGALARGPLLAALLGALEAVTADFAEGGFAAIRGRYEPYCQLLGREVVTEASARGPGICGVAVGLDDDGALLIAPAEGGNRRRVEAADVWLASER